MKATGVFYCASGRRGKLDEPGALVACDVASGHTQGRIKQTSQRRADCAKQRQGHHESIKRSVRAAHRRGQTCRRVSPLTVARSLVELALQLCQNWPQHSVRRRETHRETERQRDRERPGHSALLVCSVLGHTTAAILGSALVPSADIRIGVRLVRLSQALSHLVLRRCNCSLGGCGRVSRSCHPIENTA